MTPDQRSAAERVRRVRNGETIYAVYNQDVDAHALHWRDLGRVADAYLAEHPADDDEPPSAAELDELFRDPLFPPVARDGKRFAFVQAYVEIQTRGQLRALVKGLGQ